jgi:hypothetical protein
MEQFMCSWDTEWADFRRRHAAWLARHASEDDVLCRLPAAVVSALARPLRYGRAILTGAEADAECAFDALCRRHFAEGVYRGEFVRYAPLRAPTPPLPAEFCRAAGYTEQQIATIRAAPQATYDACVRVKGYAGRLVTDRVFLAEQNTLRDAWRALPAGARPGLPLKRSFAGTLPGGVVDAEAALAALQARFDDFCDRYGLTGLATWGLPDPAGPNLSGAPLPPHYLARQLVTVALPAHFSLLGSDDLTALMRQLQERHLREAGLTPDCCCPRAAEKYGRFLEITHYRRVAQERYGAAPRPKGFVTQLRVGLADHLGISDDYLRELCRELSRCLKTRPRPIQAGR